MDNQDYMVRGIAGDGEVRAFAATTRNIAERARQIHDTTPVVTAALGRLLTAGAMMGTMMKGDKDEIILRIQGDGPLRGLHVRADSRGNVRGYPYEPHVDIPLKRKGKLDVGGAVGAGFLSVIRDIGLKEPYSGQTALVSGEIAEDITQYFADSEQVPGACGLGVLVNPDLTVACAGGYLIQLLPFAPESDIAQLEENLKDVTSVTDLLQSGMTPDDIAQKLMAGLGAELLDESEPVYACDCSRERTAKMLRSLDIPTLREMADEMPEIEVCCHFCNEKYVFTPDELRQMIAEKEQAAPADES